MARLGDVCRVEPGQPSVVGEKIWWLTLDQVEQQTGRVIEHVYASPSEIGSSTVLFDEENVLYSKLRPNLNKVVLPDSPGIATSEMLPLKVTDQGLCRDYLAWYLRSTTFVSWAVSKVAGAKMPRLGTKTLMEAEIPLPPLAEQKRIAEELDNICVAKKDAEAIVEKLKLLAKSLFVEMFGDVNLNTKGWETEKLGDLCEIVRGGSPRPIEKFLGGTIPWIKIGDATEGDSIYLHRTKEHIIEEGLRKTRKVKPGSLIFANCGVSLGFARIVTFEGCIHDGWLALNDISERLDKIFLLHSLNQMTEHFRRIAPAGTQPNLNTDIMKRHLQVLPPLELQKKYVAFSEQLDKSRFEAQALIGKLDLLYRAKLQEYFG